MSATSATSGARAPHDTLAAKVRFLQQPGHYPEPTTCVDANETHMSWVFLTDHYAYKLKKPIRYSYLDFSTLEARHFYCQEELRLNRRLAQDVYLKLERLTLDSDQRMYLGGEGQTIDWLVKMRRLPADWMLDHLIHKNRLSQADIQRVTEVLARFYRRADSVAISPKAYQQRFAEDIQANRRELLTPDFALSIDQVESITASQLDFLSRFEKQLQQRVEQGKIIEAHGDLRPEHICLKTPPAIIDCLEFNRRFRTMDAADELAFLAMECERLGASFIGPTLFDGYRHITGDHTDERLIQFYMSYRATLWAKLTVWHTKDPLDHELDKLDRKAKTYLQLAQQHIQQALS